MSRDDRLRLAAVGYALAILTPLFVAWTGPRSQDRGFWIEFAVALGFIGLAMLGLQAVLTARISRVSSTLGQDALLQFHRQAGIVALGFVLAHPVILLIADRSNWSFLDPREDLIWAVLLTTVLIAVPSTVVTSIWREKLRIPYEWWRLAHGVLAVLIVVIGLVHIARIRYYLESGWKQALWLGIGAASIGSVLYVRALKPMFVRARPYTVDSVELIAEETWALTLSPDRGEALSFRAGQFAFLTIADSPFAIEQHPFSMSSSARTRDEVRFGIKELGDYTRQIGTIPEGSRAFVDGPFGSTQLPEDVPGLMLVAGGIGITPIMSMVRTLHDDRSTMPVVLIYANVRADEVAYEDELHAIADDIDLTVVQVLEEPPDDWDGPTGFVSEELLAEVLPAEGAEEWWYVLVGPPPMMEAVETALIELGVPIERIESERFDIGGSGNAGRRATGVRRLVVALGAVMVGAAMLFAW